MSHRRAIAVFSLLAFAPGVSSGQTPDPAAERARLGNERIQAEVERQAQQELEQRNRVTQPAPVINATPPAPQQSTPRDRPAEPARPAADPSQTERGLGQLRELGRLKDAGYLTDEEFQRIKQRILESHF